jgi:predicted glycoside hydrolase/deacetylase ChbG (UPF0249 family)
MVNTPGFQEGVRLAKNTPSLGVGFHFNLTYGKPLSQIEEVPTLVDSAGYFLKMNFKNPPSWNEEDVRKELYKQWEYVQNSGLSITHLDSHHYIQRFPSVYSCYTKLATCHNLPMRQTFQFEKKYNFDTFEPIFSSKSQLPTSHPPTTDYFIGDVYFQENRLHQLTKHLEELHNGITEINCHPGYVDEELKKLSTWTSYRELELEILTKQKIRDLIHQKNIKLSTFSGLRSR